MKSRDILPLWFFASLFRFASMATTYNAKLAGKTCPICEERIADTLHHLVPRKFGGAKDDESMFGRRKIHLCCSCHMNLHICKSEKQLAKSYKSLRSILADKKLIRKIRSLPERFHSPPGTKKTRKIVLALFRRPDDEDTTRELQRSKSQRNA